MQLLSADCNVVASTALGLLPSLCSIVTQLVGAIVCLGLLQGKLVLLLLGCFFGMLLGTGLMVFYDVYASVTYLSHLGLGHMLRNAATSGLFCWLVFAVPLVPCALYQLHKGFDDPYFGKFTLKRNGKPRMPMEKRFKMYVTVSLAGGGALLAVYLLAGILSARS